MNIKKNKKTQRAFDNAIEFLLFSYFRIDFNSSRDEIIDVAIERAYADAAQQGAYNTLVSSKQRGVAKDAKQAGKKLIMDFIQTVEKTEFTKKHDVCCDCLVRAFESIRNKNNEGLPAFSFGNAQKWLNMTTKYIYLLAALYSEVDPEHSFAKEYSRYADYEDVLEIPVDSFIIEKVWNDLPTVELPLRNSSKRTGKYNAEKIVPWSKWDRDTYIRFRHAFTAAVSKPILWEGTAWIEIARHRRTE